MDLAWGTVPDWFGAVGTVGALVTAVTFYVLDQLRRRREQAYSFITWLTLLSEEAIPPDDTKVVVYNASSAPIRYPVLLMSNADEPDGWKAVSLSNDRSAVLPAETVTTFFKATDYDPLMKRAYIVFRDSADKQWVKTLRSSSGVKEGQFISRRKARKAGIKAGW